MRSYGIKIAVAAVIVITVLAVVLCSSSKNNEKYEGGTLVKACDDSLYAFAVMQNDEEKDEKAINAYAVNESDISENVYDSDIEAYIDSLSDGLVYVGWDEE